LSEASSPSRVVLLKRFRDLREYMCLLGEHVNLIYSSIDRIEKDMDEMRREHKSAVDENQKELQQIKEIMVTKVEMDSFLKELGDAVTGAFPSISVSIPPQPR
jgi:hypothetical protein